MDSGDEEEENQEEPEVRRATAALISNLFSLAPFECLHQ